MSQAGILTGGGGGGSGTIQYLQGNSGGDVGPNGSGEIFLLGSGSVTVAGNAGTNTLTVSVSGTGTTWNDKSTSFSADVNNGYFVTGNATASLPAVAAQGDIIEFIVIGSVTLTIQADTGQTIRIGTAVSSSAGTAVNTASGDSIRLIYRTVGTSWNADSVIGIWGVA